MFRSKSRTEKVADSIKSAASDAGAVVADKAAEVKDAVLDSSAYGTAKDRVSEAAGTVKHSYDDTRDAAASAFAEARERASEKSADAADSARERAERLRELAQERRDEARERAEGAGETVRDRASDAAWTARVAAADAGEKAKNTWVGTVLPELGGVLAAVASVVRDVRKTASSAASDAADAASPRLESVRDTARDVAGESQHRASDAWSVLKGDAVAKKKSSGASKVLLLLVGLAAAGAAAYVAFRNKQQADDPWTAPLTDPVGPAGDVDVNASGQSLKDKAASAVETAKDKVADAADTVKDKAAGAVEAAKEKVADAKDHTGELDEQTNAGGQVSELDADPRIGSDAVEGEMPVAQEQPMSAAGESADFEAPSTEETYEQLESDADVDGTHDSTPEGEHRA